MCPYMAIGRVGPRDVKNLTARRSLRLLCTDLGEFCLSNCVSFGAETVEKDPSICIVKTSRNDNAGTEIRQIKLAQLKEWRTLAFLRRILRQASSNYRGLI